MRTPGTTRPASRPAKYLTEKWPVLHAGTVPKVDLVTWDFRVWGDVENPIRLSWEELEYLPAAEVTVDIHCVTRWSRFDTSFRGVHWRDLAWELVRPKPSARFVVAHAEQGYTSNLPLEALEADDALIAYEADGEPLTPDHGWPLRLMVPSRYFWKSAKWLRGLELGSTMTSRGSGSGTATTTTPISGARSATGSNHATLRVHTSGARQCARHWACSEWHCCLTVERRLVKDCANCGKPA